ncbi:MULTISPECIES: ABC transporter permease [Chryseobacterium]|uniref:ABC transport system permease protein n=1 Tax=Chryseobacterium camelliae TaxID=1265445 RepID=A0ABU0TE49_9FLAO|nr:MULTISPECIES: ABC transporter permease [Chryseobacterium]MDT3406866.1 putative ABC transport system permease protein [Pseudacidovorax intermedius]MDQ1095338.1 putative ABC transport system permease protein [Chryseobacterium camelliae]MDQ1099277.1 putative ABC transport system permease protein [Chryseobacterium sp. SORGH_AS_1048]MDR6086626.1 putative ABC transport system permease protein [Chryseobacterium sp. SORGH_AS_0909]MDR6130997.1 putative ABC transport system permease protein [Chryseob
MLKNWLKIAFINYRKNWLSTLINILGLSVGLCVFLLIFIHWQDEKSYEQWIPGKENIYLVENKISDFGTMVVSSYPELAVSKEKFPEIEDYTIANIWSNYKVRLISGSKSAFVSSCRASDSFFDFFPLEKVAGSYKDAISDKTKITISEDTAKMLFGDEYKNCIGKTITQDIPNSIPLVITAVYRNPEQNSVFKPGFIMKNEGLDNKNDSNLQWTNYSYIGYFRLKPGTDIASLEKKLSDLMAEQEKITTLKRGQKYDGKKKAEIFLTPVGKMKLDAKSEGIEKGDKKSIMILLSLSALILLLSGINLINLKTAQASQRAKEVGVRKAVGSTRSKLVLQFLLETFMICFAAFIIALVLIELFLPVYNKFLNKEIKLNNPSVFIYSGLLLIVFSLISGLIPSFYLSNFKPINTLKGNFSRSRSGVWLRNSILMLQLIISSFFMICALVIHSQVNYMMNKDLGFKGDQVIQIQFKKTDGQNDYNYKKYIRLKNEISKISGVTDITGSLNSIGLGITNASSVQNAADTTQSIQNVLLGAIDYNYFKFYKMKFVAGRDLDLRFASDTITGAVANETFIKKMGWSKNQALGKEVYPDWEKRKKYKIIGVLKDFYFNGVDKPVEPVLFFNYDRNQAKQNMSNIQIKLDKNDINGTLNRIKEFWTTKAEPGYPYDFEFVDKQFAKTFEKFQKQKTLFTMLNAAVLVIALSGLFALSSLLIEQQLRDVAIKKTLGADEKTIIWDLTKRFLTICTIAVLISMPFGYYAMNEWLKDFAYRIDMPVWPYALSLILLLILTFAVVSFKAYRATKINLVKYLKYE